MALAALPDPPYVAVVFTSLRTADDPEGDAHAAVADRAGVQRLGREQWDAEYRVVVARVERADGSTPASASSGDGGGSVR